MRTSGFEAISARALGKELGSSSSPMFSDMNEVLDAIRTAALCVRHPEDFPLEEVSKMLSYHFSGIMSIIKSGEEEN